MVDQKKDNPPSALKEMDRDESAIALEQPQSFGKAILPVIACGAGLFSDGYINNVSCLHSRLSSKLTCLQVIGSVITIFAMQYGDQWKTSTAKHYLPDIAFAGTVVGQLAFGYLYVQ